MPTHQVLAAEKGSLPDLLDAFRDAEGCESRAIIKCVGADDGERFTPRHRRERRAAREAIVSQLRDPRAQIDRGADDRRLQPQFHIRKVIRNHGNAARNVDLRKGTAGLERAFPDRRQPFRQGNAGERGTVHKGRIPDAPDVCPDGNRRDDAAGIKGAVGDLRYGKAAVGIRDDHVAARIADPRHLIGGPCIDGLEFQPAVVLADERHGLRPFGVGVFVPRIACPYPERILSGLERPERIGIAADGIFLLFDADDVIRRVFHGIPGKRERLRIDRNIDGRIQRGRPSDKSYEVCPAVRVSPSGAACAGR